MKLTKAIFSAVIFLILSEAHAFQFVLSEHTEHGTISVFVENPSSHAEKWRFQATTNFGDTLTVEYSVAANSALMFTSELVGEWLQAGFPGSEPTGWSEYISGELNGFYSHSNGTVNDPFFGGGPGRPPGYEVYGEKELDRSIAVQQLAMSLIRLSNDYAAQRGYLGCVGSVAGAIGGTIFGAQHHRQNVRGFRLGTVTRNAVRASGVALGAVALGGAAVSASVCLAVFFTN